MDVGDWITDPPWVYYIYPRTDEEKSSRKSCISRSGGDRSGVEDGQGEAARCKSMDVIGGRRAKAACGLKATLTELS